MGLDNFKTPNSVWMEELEKRAEDRGLSICYCDDSPKSQYFKIEGSEACVVGKTHHTRRSRRNQPGIELDFDVPNWIDNPEEIPFTIKDNLEIVDIFSIIVGYFTPGSYQADQDKFTILTEEILDEIPESGHKRFGTTPEGYRSPLDKHVNSWDRIFENI